MIQMNKVLTLRKYVAASVHDLENLSNKQIVCVSPKKFNDPIDTYFYFSVDDCFKKSKKILIGQNKRQYQACLKVNSTANTLVSMFLYPKTLTLLSLALIKSSTFSPALTSLL